MLRIAIALCVAVTAWAAPWAGRALHASVAASSGSVLIMGGTDGQNVLNDIWRLDSGSSWSQVNVISPFQGKYGHGAVRLTSGKIVVTGGFTSRDPVTATNDVLTSDDDGRSWSRFSGNTWWSARAGHASISVDGSTVMVLGGAAPSILSSTGLMCQANIWVSRSSGVNAWTDLGSSLVTARVGLAAVVKSGNIIIAGGNTCANGFPILNDAWVSSNGGTSWAQLSTGDPLLSRTLFPAVVLSSGTIVLSGGRAPDSVSRRDVATSTDGITISAASTAAPWVGRSGHTMIALPDSSIILMGGTEQDPLTARSALNDVWKSSSSGSTWSIVCDPGSYGLTACQTCPAGSFCPAGSTAAQPCPAGSFCPAGSSAAQPCPADKVPANPPASCVDASSSSTGLIVGIVVGVVVIGGGAAAFVLWRKRQMSK